MEDPLPQQRSSVGSSSSQSHHNVAANSLALFEQSWRAYRGIVDHDYMEHRALTAAVAQNLPQLLPVSSKGWMADLGCGDLGLLAPILLPLPLAGFIGVDATAEVLPQAAKRLGSSPPWPCEWVAADLLNWSEERSHLVLTAAAEKGGEAPPQLAVVSCLFALHHLADPLKKRVLAALRPCLAPGGCLLVADVFREDGETREDYMIRYRARIQSWRELDSESRALIDAHVSSSDFPSEKSVFQQLAAEAGWTSRWLWHGTHRAESLLLLQPST